MGRKTVGCEASDWSLILLDDPILVGPLFPFLDPPEPMEDDLDGTHVSDTDTRPYTRTSASRGSGSDLTLIRR